MKEGVLTSSDVSDVELLGKVLNCMNTTVGRVIFIFVGLKFNETKPYNTY